MNTTKITAEQIATRIEAAKIFRGVEHPIKLHPMKKAGEVIPGAFWANVGHTDGSKGFRLNVHVDARSGHAFLSFGSCSLALDLRDAAQVEADDAAAAQVEAERKARVDAGRAQLQAEAAARDATPSPGHLLLVHGDVLQIAHPRGGVYYWHVATIRGGALADGRDPVAALEENTRRREGRIMSSAPESEGGGGPAWCDEEFLFESATVIAADGLNMATRLNRSRKADGLGADLLAANIGDRVELNGRVFVLALERGHWVKLSPVLVDATCGEVVPTDVARRISGGYALDVRCLKPLPNGAAREASK